MLDFTVYNTIHALLCDLNIVFLCNLQSAKCISTMNSIIKLLLLLCLKHDGMTNLWAPGVSN